MNPMQYAYLAIDENGYGPLMGPLLVTGILATADVDSGWDGFISDSKRFFSRNSSGFARVEESALALFHLVHGFYPSSVEDLLSSSGDFSCSEPSSSCYDFLPPIFSYGRREKAESKREELALFCRQHGIRLLGIRVAVVCPDQFNRFFNKSERRKDYLNFLQFSENIHWALKKSSSLSVAAGKIGARAKYDSFLRDNFTDWTLTTFSQASDTSSYSLTSGGRECRIAFLKNLEERSFLGVCCGIYGKYIRESIMTSINRFCGFSNGNEISGYRDARTRKFQDHRILHFSSEERKNCLFRCR
jgi:hypothetical protein